MFFAITVQGARLGDATVAANALLLNGLLLTAHALDGLAHAVEALCGHAIGARDRTALRRSMVVACGWSLLASALFALLFLLGGHWFVEMQTDIASVRETAFQYLPYLAVLPLIAVWSYLLDGLFIGATRAREPGSQVSALLQKGACVSCHGDNFSKPIDGSYPKIAGQHADYLYASLKSYKMDHGAYVGRSNGVMAGIAKQFSNAELKELANYIGSLDGDLRVVPQSRFR